MGTIVQKYGGSSVSTPEKLQKVAQRIVETQQLGHKVVVVVSAMGDTTNQLLSLAKEVSPQPQRRELDMLLTVGERISMSLLSMAIQDLGAPAVSFTGSQSGIITTHTHTNAVPHAHAHAHTHTYIRRNGHNHNHHCVHTDSSQYQYSHPTQ